MRGCWGSEVRHFATALDLLARHSATIPWARIGATAFGLDELNEALRQAEALAFTKALVAPNGVAEVSDSGIGRSAHAQAGPFSRSS